jgi:UDP-2,3-diacylglucosamine pyrophosphatase LpxH
MPHTVVLSDLHLSEIDRGEGPWMRYRQAPFVPDPDVAGMLAGVLRAVPDPRELTVVLAGDVFDLDAPRVASGRSVPHDLPRTSAHAVAALSAILDDHPVFVDALAGVLASGARLVVLSGNHDAQLVFPDVRALFLARLAAAAARLSTSPPRAFTARVVFRAWFHVTPDGVLVEHGHQYDPSSCHRYPMSPFTPDGRAIEPTLGSLGSRHLIARIGTVNPHDDSTLPVSPRDFVAHWARHYLFSLRSPALIWITGVARTLARLRRHRPREEPHLARERLQADLHAVARETGAEIHAVAGHAGLRAAPLGDRLGRVARELWVDRIAVALLGLLAAAVLWRFVPGPPGLALLVAPLLVIGYGRATPKAPLHESWRRVDRAARRIAALHGVRAVIFGHTHVARGAWDGGVFIGNSGSWPAVIDGARRAAVERPFIWLESTANALRGGLYAWTGGRLEPRAVGELYSLGTSQESATPGSEAMNAMAKNVGYPSGSAT